jgi:hypothetical protein
VQSRHATSPNRACGGRYRDAPRTRRRDRGERRWRFGSMDGSGARVDPRTGSAGFGASPHFIWRVYRRVPARSRPHRAVRNSSPTGVGAAMPFGRAAAGVDAKARMPTRSRGGQARRRADACDRTGPRAARGWRVARECPARGAGPRRLLSFVSLAARWQARHGTPTPSCSRRPGRTCHHPAANGTSHRRRTPAPDDRRELSRRPKRTPTRRTRPALALRRRCEGVCRAPQATRAVVRWSTGDEPDTRLGRAREAQSPGDSGVDSPPDWTPDRGSGARVRGCPMFTGVGGLFGMEGWW